MTEKTLGEIYFDAFWRTAPGVAHIAWHALSEGEREGHEAGARAVVDAWREAGDGEERLPDDAPASGPAKVIVVTTETGREIRYAAPDFGMLTDGTLLVGARDAGGDSTGKITVAAGHAPGRWTTVRKDGTTVPDSTAVALGIAKRALDKILRRSEDGGEQPFGRPEIGAIARDALEGIWTETEG